MVQRVTPATRRPDGRGPPTARRAPRPAPAGPDRVAGAAGRVTVGGGEPLAAGVRTAMEARFGYDFGRIAIHAAGPGASPAGVRAFTSGHHVFLAPGCDRSDTALLAHELAHVVQQATGRAAALRGAGGDEARREALEHEAERASVAPAAAGPLRPLPAPPGGSPVVQFDRPERRKKTGGGPEHPKNVSIRLRLGGGDFCKPFTKEELDAGLDLQVSTDMQRLVQEYFPSQYGAEATALYDDFLTRVPGDSLARQVFKDPSSELVQAFARHPASLRRQRELIDAIQQQFPSRCRSFPAGKVHDVPLADLVPADELTKPIVFDDPLTIPGLLAGGISDSAVGPDTREVSGRVQLQWVNNQGITLGSLRLRLHVTVRDAVDFCPGAMGGLAARLVTIPMSRLEASGIAYDVPFQVDYDLPQANVAMRTDAAKGCP